MARKCVFCEIANGKLPASLIYQDEKFSVLMDAYPLAEGHVLIIPHAHVQHLSDLDPADQNTLFSLGAKARIALRNAGYGVRGANILLNDGKAANQTVPHVHLHVIPRSSYDLIKSLPKLFLHVTGVFGIQTSRAKLDAIAQKVAKEFNALP
jgi:histidine triad (HIT) family protein